MFFNKTRATRLVKNTSYFTALSAITYWGASNEAREKAKLEKENPTCNVVKRYVPVSSGVGYFELKLEPKVKKEEQSVRMRK